MGGYDVASKPPVRVQPRRVDYGTEEVFDLLGLTRDQLTAVIHMLGHSSRTMRDAWGMTEGEQNSASRLYGDIESHRRPLTSCQQRRCNALMHLIRDGYDDMQKRLETTHGIPDDAPIRSWFSRIVFDHRPQVADYIADTYIILIGSDGSVLPVRPGEDIPAWEPKAPE